MNLKHPIAKQELARLKNKAMSFAFVLLLMLGILYVQAKHFPYQPKDTADLKAVSKQPDKLVFKDGDVIFQRSSGELSDVIADVTQSPLTHCGLVSVEGKNVYVYEAIDKVGKTLLEHWIVRGKDSKFALLRLKNLKDEDAEKVIREAEKFIGTPYDYKYSLDDGHIYCSELVYKAYKRGMKLQLGTLQKLKQLKFKGNEKFIKELNGGEIPLERVMVTPHSLYMDKRFNVIYDDFKLKGGAPDGNNGKDPGGGSAR